MLHRLDWFIALRDLLSTRRNTFLSILTLLSVAGVATGVGFLMMVISVMAGFERDFVDQILGLDAHIEIQGERGMANPEIWIERIREHRRVADAGAFVDGEILIAHAGQTRGATLRGIDPEQQVTDLGKTLHGACQGLALPACLKDDSLPGIIVGAELAQEMRLFLSSHSQVELISPFGQMGPLGYEPHVAVFAANGTFRSGFYEYDTQRVYVSLEAAKRFFETRGRVKGFEVRVKDLNEVAKIRTDLERMLLPLSQKEGEPFRIQDWQQRNQKLFAALELEKVVMFIVLMLIVVVASFVIFVTLTMLVLDKRPQVAILRTLGWSRQRIRRIFLIAGGLIGMTGAGFGFIGGMTLCVLLKRYQFVELPPQYYVTTIPVEIRWPEITAILASAILIAIIAAVWPASRASGTLPVEILRDEG